MREKQICLVVTFHTTAEAMALEGICRDRGIPGKLISAPRSLSADCGIAWRSPVDARADVERAITEAALEIDGLHEIPV